MSQLDYKDRRCTLCQGLDLVAAGVSPTLAGDTITMFRCSACHSYVPDYFAEWERMLLLPSQLELHEGLWKKENEQDYLEGRDSLEDLSQHLLQSLVEKPVVRVLELGSGRGWLSAALKHSGCDVVAVEPSKFLVEKARAIFSMEEEFVNLEALDYLQDCDREFDLIIMWHVIEHIENPLDIMKMARDRLTENGVFALQTPLPLQDYVYPEHLFFTVPKTFRFLANSLDLPIQNLEIDLNHAFISCVLGGNGDQSVDEETMDAAFLVNGYFDELHNASTLASKRLSSIEEMGGNLFSLEEQYLDMQRRASESDANLIAARQLAEERYISMEKMSASTDELNLSLGNARKLAEERFATIETMSKSIDQLNLSRDHACTLAEERFATIEKMNASIDQLTLSRDHACALAEERFEAMGGMEVMITTREASIAEMAAEIVEKNTLLAGKDTTIENLEKVADMQHWTYPIRRVIKYLRGLFPGSTRNEGNDE